MSPKSDSPTTEKAAEKDKKDTKEEKKEEKEEPMQIDDEELSEEDKKLKVKPNGPNTLVIVPKILGPLSHQIPYRKP